MEGFWGGVIIAIIDFIMVFLVLGGLAFVIIGLKRVVSTMEEQQSESSPPLNVRGPQIEHQAEVQGGETHTESQIAAILAAIQEFTSLAPGTFTLDTIEPISTETLESIQAAHMTQTQQRKALIAAITVAIHEFTSMPVGTFHITGIKPLGRVSAWKLAGRLELMGMDAVGR